MKRILTLFAAFILACCIPFFSASAEDAQGVTIYGDPATPHCFYERMVQLPDGTLLATWLREFPINSGWAGMQDPQFFASTDGGKSWGLRSEIAPEADGISKDKLGMPGLFVFPQELGGYPAGTILYAVSDWDTESEYTIHIWRSTDGGASWQLHSQLAPRAGRSTWEPEFAVSADGRLVCYYSDERQTGYDQCIAYEVSADGGVSWGGYTIIAGEYEEGWVPGVSPTNWRPGMPRVQKLNDGTYLMAHENIAVAQNGVITLRRSADGLAWGDPLELGSPVTTGSETAFQCPTLALVQDGSANGRLFLRGMNDNCSPSQCFTSTDGGYTWSLIDAPLTAVRNEARGSSWSGTFLASGAKLLELNNYFNGEYNEIRFGEGTLYGGQLLVSGADYKLVNAASGLCVDDPAGSMEQGAQMILWTDNSLKTQSWHLLEDAGAYKLRCNYSGLILDGKEGSSEPGAIVRQWEDNGAPAQRWVLEPAGGGAFRIKNLHGGLYLDTEGQQAGLHAPLVQMPRSESAAQTWRLERIYEIVRLGSYNIAGTYIRHTSADNVVIDSQFTTLPLKDSEWRVVPGLADSACVSFEAVNLPGYYLRHRAGRLILSQDDGTELMRADATWRLAPGLADGGCVSIGSYNIAGNYIRHRDGVLYITPITSPLDQADATFRQIKQ